MKTPLPTLLAIALAASVAHAQDNPPAPPPRPETPVYPPEGQRPPEERRKTEADRPPEGHHPEGGPRRPQARPDGERPPGDLRNDGPRREGERPQGPRGDGPRREGGPRPDGPRGEDGPRFAQPPPAAVLKPRPYLGVVTMPAPPAVAAQARLPEGFGLVVEEVVPDSPAKAAGLERYDVLTRFDDQKLVDPDQLAALVRAAGKDTEATLTVLRHGEEKKLTVKVGEKALLDRPAGPVRIPLPDPETLKRRYEGFRDKLGGQAGDLQRRAQELQRDWQRRMKEFQEQVEQWRKNPGGKFPETPKFPTLGPTEEAGPLPPDVLREVHPGGAPSVQRSQDGATTTWSTANAHVAIKDEAGSIEVRSDGGHRVVTAKDAKGDTIFDGPIDTVEQREHLPDAVRQKLRQIEARTRIEHREIQREQNPPPPGAGSNVQ
jgi:hypothetical protein